MINKFCDLISSAVVGSGLGYFIGLYFSYKILGLIIGFFLGIISGIMKIYGIVK